MLERRRKEGRRSMPKRGSPVLAQFAVPPTVQAVNPVLETDPSNGLSYRSGEATPFVEVLIAANRNWCELISAETLLNKAINPIDPDLVRGDAICILETVLTKIQADDPDPDLIRGEPPLSV
jgi:hypothetical protein